MDTTQITTFSHHSELSLWFWLSLLESAIIIGLIFLLVKKKAQYTMSVGISKSDLKASINDSGNPENIVNSFWKADELYKELCKKYHPDKFHETPLETTAKELFQEISHHKRNYQKLQELKIIAEQKLNMNF